MTPQDLARADVYGKEFAEVAAGIRMPVVRPAHGSGATAADLFVCDCAFQCSATEGPEARDIAYDDLIFPKIPRKLPVVLSPEEVTRMIEAAPNRMHRAMLMVLYFTGIRRTEASLLKVSDVDTERMVIHIRQGKGSRDRDVPMTPKLLEALREYWRWKRPKVYLFPSTEGQRGIDQPISDHTIWYICSEAAKRAGIKKRIGAHTLRHSFATTLMESGTDLSSETRPIG
jgi:integrase